MFEDRKGLVSTSALGGKKQQINIAMPFSFVYVIFRNVPRENGNF